MTDTAASTAAAPRVPPFDLAVPDDGYAWWYLDAISDDGRHALTVIFFIGSVFSPYYARARRRGPTAALAHPAVNAVLYGRPARWSMTERTAGAVARAPARLAIGPSAIALAPAGDALEIELDEITAPWPRRLRGRLRVLLPPAPGIEPFALDRAGDHLWQPIAPSTRVEVALDAPALGWSGHAYVDSNRGRVPLERSFSRWSWSRAHAADGSARVRYDVVERDGRRRRRTLAVAPGADPVERDAPEERDETLPPTRWWRVARPTRLAPDARLSALETLEDTPFYARSRYREGGPGAWRRTVHESLDLERFARRPVQALLALRMPRRGGPGISRDEPPRTATVP